MTATALAVVPPYKPSSADADDARDSSRALARLMTGHRVHVKASSSDGAPEQSFILPAAAVRLLTDILANMADGRAITLIPNEAELTTQQAADMLNVSRPHVVKLLENGALPFTKTGTHRRVRFNDLIDYRSRLKKCQAEALAALAAEDQTLGLIG